MADETKSNAPPPREAARSALDRMRATAPADKESDSDDETVIGYQNDPELSTTTPHWVEARFSLAAHGRSGLLTPFRRAGWQPVSRRNLEFSNMYENPTTGKYAVFKWRKDENNVSRRYWCTFARSDEGYRNALLADLGAEAVEKCSNLHLSALMQSCVNDDDGSLNARLLQKQVDAMDAVVNPSSTIDDGLNYEPLQAAIATEERADRRAILDGCRRTVLRLWALDPRFRRDGLFPVPLNALDPPDHKHAIYSWVGAYQNHCEAILRNNKAHGHRMFTGPQLAAARRYLRRHGRMVEMVCATYPRLPREAAEFLCTPPREAGARPEFQLDHYIAPVSDCVHTMVVMLAFPNASFGDNNRYLTKNGYGSLFVADLAREAVVQTFRDARAALREA